MAISFCLILFLLLVTSCSSQLVHLYVSPSNQTYFQNCLSPSYPCPLQTALNIVSDNSLTGKTHFLLSLLAGNFTYEEDPFDILLFHDISIQFEANDTNSKVIFHPFSTRSFFSLQSNEDHIFFTISFFNIHFISFEKQFSNLFTQTSTNIVISNLNISNCFFNNVNIASFENSFIFNSILKKSSINYRINDGTGQTTFKNSIFRNFQVPSQACVFFSKFLFIENSFFENSSSNFTFFCGTNLNVINSNFSNFDFKFGLGSFERSVKVEGSTVENSKFG